MNVSTGLTDNDPMTIQGWMTGNLQRVARWTAPIMAVSSPLDRKIIVQHNLGRRPDFYNVTPWGNCTIWAGEDDQAVWSETSIQLTASAVSITVAVAVGTLS